MRRIGNKIRLYFNNWNLKNRIIALFLCAGFVIILLSAAAYGGLWTMAVRSETEEMSAQVFSALEANLEDSLNSLSNHSHLIIGNDNIQTFLRNRYDYNNVSAVQKVQNELAAYLGIDSKISSIYVFSENDTVISLDTVRNKEVRHKLHEMPWYDEVRKREGYWYVDLNADNSFYMEKDTPCISFIRMILDLNDYHPIGALVINVTQEYLLQALGSLETSNYESALFSIDGNYVFGNFEENVKNEIIQKISQNKNKNSFFFKYKGNHYHARQNINEKYGWNLVVLTKTTETEKNFSKYMLVFLFIMFGIFCGSLTFIVQIMNNSFTKPIQLLAKQMKKAESGNFDTLEIGYKKDEIGILVHGYNSMVKKIGELFENLEEEQREKFKAQFEILQTQIKPHFLYNSLETSRALLKKGDNDQAEQMVHFLSEYYKRTLSDGRDEVTIQEELQIVQDYLKVQTTRFPNRCDIIYDIDDDLLNIRIPKLTLQPLVENCFVHGIIPSRYECTLVISMFGDDENAYIEISDDGIGMSPEKVTEIMNMENVAFADKKQRKGFGIRNTVTRLEIFFKTKDIFSLESEVGAGTKFHIHIPVMKE